MNESSSMPFMRQLQRLQRASVTREVFIFLAFILLTLLMTWPWALHLRDAIPDPGDPYVHAYFLWWDFHQTFHDPLHLFEATMFYPYHQTLAFSESDYGIALLFFPFFALGLRPLTIYILATLFGFAFTGYGAFRLARTLNLSNGAAWVTGIVFAFVPYRFNQLSHLPIIFTGWVPLLLEALILFTRERSWKRAGWLGLTFLMNALTCLTWFVLTSIPLALSALFLMARYRAWREKTFWLRGGIATGAALLVLFPFLLPYYRVSQALGFIRSSAEVTEYSARFINWLAVEERNKLWHGLGGAGIRNEMVLFPGLMPPLLLLAAMFSALAVAVRSVRAPPRIFRALREMNWTSMFRQEVRSEAFALGFIWTIIGFLGSFGLNSFFHRALYEYVPLFRSMRVAARWSMIAYLGLALLSGLGAQSCAGLVRRHWSNLQMWATYALIIILILFEQRVAPLHLMRGEADPDQLTLRLRETHMNGGLVELPAGPKRTLYMARAADHGHPLVTAINSFVPPIEQEIESLTNTRPMPDRLLELFESIPVSYLTVHNASLNPESRAALESFLARGIASGRLRFIRSYGYHRRRADLYAVTKTEPDARSEAPLPPPLSMEEINEGLSDLPGQFRETGFFIYRLFKASYGRMPKYAEFMPDAHAIREELDREARGGTPQLEKNEREFTENWTNRAEFKKVFDGRSNEEYVSMLFNNMGVTPDALESERLVRELNSGVETRAGVLRQAAQNEAFTLREFNSAFVLMHYFAYLKRDPEEDGHKFWLSVINSGVEPGDIHIEFISSPESRLKEGEP
ncbi:MAG TPA: DUF4214 domain-containing protein [Pyrinomonadaceae bacterium]|jgi:hypothetical protein|nr:DUF4214 domain-containing protein [Pyrinomonadaceae bacterium]